VVVLFTYGTDLCNWFQMLTNLENGLAEDGSMIQLSDTRLLGTCYLKTLSVSSAAVMHSGYLVFYCLECLHIDMVS